MDARRRGIDLKTGKKPCNEAARNRLQNHPNEEPDRLRHAYTAMLDTYLNGFGDEAAQALDKAIRAWHAGIPVELETKTHNFVPKTHKLHPKTHKLSSILPVPMPLPEAVTAGRFGYEEDGKPVKPGSHEIRAITENHAEKIIDLMETVAALEKRPRMPQADEAAAKSKAALDAYAEDFGQVAADRLEVYARRQAARKRAR